MNRGWKVIQNFRGKGLSGAKKKPDKIHLCKICGGRVVNGKICPSCLDYLEKQKRREALL